MPVITVNFIWGLSCVYADSDHGGVTMQRAIIYLCLVLRLGLGPEQHELCHVRLGNNEFRASSEAPVVDYIFRAFVSYSLDRHI